MSTELVVVLVVGTLRIARKSLITSAVVDSVDSVDSVTIDLFHFALCSLGKRRLLKLIVVDSGTLLKQWST